MKYTLLDMTQNILSAMDSMEVNSITDTTEARQVAQIIRTAYFNIISRADLPEHKQLFNLVSSGYVSQPVLLSKPDNVSRIETIKYNKATITDPEDNYTYVTILPITQFLDMTLQFDTTDTDVDTMTLNGKTFYYKNERAPTYCTIVDDQYLVFDSYDSAVDSTLQSSKTLCYGIVIPTFIIADSFVPSLDEQQFPLLLNEAKSLAFLELKQIAHDQAIRESRRQWNSLQRTKSLNKGSDFDQLANFGRN